MSIQPGYIKRILVCLPVMLLMIVALRAAPLTQVKVASPDNSTVLEVSTAEGGRLMYRVLYRQQPATRWSPMGLQVNNTSLHAHTAIQKVAYRNINERTFWPLGESDTLVNHCREATLQCSSSGMRWKVIARAYNGSIAFRYEVKGTGTIQKEYTSFYFTVPYTLYQYNQESVFTPTALDTFSMTCDLPATFAGKHGYIHIGEADNTSYTKAELKRSEEPDAVSVFFARDTAVRFTKQLLTPWRTISIAEQAIDLHRCSQLNVVLCADTKNKVPAWVKPGKLIRAQLTTQSGLECIDFAAAHHFQYIMYDAGWYGAEFRSTSNPTQVIPAIDMPKVIAYGKQKGIGVILYVNYVGLRQWLDTLLPLYKQWGVAGMKFGFVDGLTQEGLTWLSAAMQKVYNHGLLLNIHDNYKPTGLSRRYPQLLTQEGIRGDENCPDAFHNTLLPFTRYLAGPADFTYCYPNATNSYSKQIKVSKAQQLALTVVYFSPLQAIFWYGKPLEYTNEGEIAFFTHVPTVWNETHYLAGEPGKYISVARRNGDTWFIGNAAGLEDWNITLPLHFLQPGISYTATVWEDDGKGSIQQRQFAVKKGDMLPVALKAKGGQAIMIQK